ncbi:MAG TPA: PstS family phosphate ABC transporter substrate-binding protein [Vicinamibacterales bacterium]|nr:PstS family phosphate ABC transporter substrate-binding protein [Vicinamibacterales bacterium]
MTRKVRWLVPLGMAVALVTAAAVTAAIRGTVNSDGSSTVAPFAQAAAESFERKYRGANVLVGVSGTGGGFERFCKNETDLSNASRPIRLSEAARCHEERIGYIQFLVANDGIAIVVNRQNTWANCLTVSELKKAWDRGSNVNSWNDIRPSFPNVPLKLFGPGTDSGTFEFFTEKINGRARQSRSDYSASENDNVLVSGVAGERGAMGYFGLSYYLENKSRLKVLRVDGGNGCTTPTVASVQSRAYRPLSRGLFVYAKKKAFKRDVVAAFIRHMIQNEKTIAQRARIVPLTKAQLRKAQRQYNTAIRNRKDY